MNKLWMASPLFFIYPALMQASFVSYIGISGGVNQNTADIELSTFLGEPGNFSAGPSADVDTDYLSGIGQIQLGLGFSGERFYLGIEAVGQLFSGQFDDVHANDEQINFGSSTPLTILIQDEAALHLHDFEVALDLKPGVYILKNTLLYTRLGIGINEMELRQTSTVSSSSLHKAFDANTTESETVYPWRIGLGLERRLTEHFSIAMDYVYSQYGDISTQGHGQAFFLPNDPPTPPEQLNTLDSQSEASNVSRQVVTLGLNYYL